MINSLQSLRGIFAIMIFLSHFGITETERAFYPGGTMGVEYFMVLSGFVLCAGYERRLDAHNIGYKNFMIRRLIRIWPLHLACLTAYFVAFNREPLNVAVVVPNMLMLQAWVPDIKVYYGCNTPSWCLSVFMFLYACFPLLILLYKKYTRITIRLFVALWALYIVYLALLPMDLGESAELWLTRVAPPVRLLDFVMGIMLWHQYRRLSEHNAVVSVRRCPAVIKTIIEMMPLLLYAVAAIWSESLPIKWCSEAIWWLPTLLCVLTYSLFDQEGGMISRLLNNKWLVAFGNASFCFYLMHIIVIQLCYRVMNYCGEDIDRLAMLFITLAAGIAASMAVSRYVDTPFGNYLKRKLLR